MIQIKLWSSEYATDEAGKKYIDLTSGGIFAAGFGPNDWEIKTAISGITHFCSYSPKYGNYNRDKYIELLKEITGFESVALFSAGTEATEAFWRTCRIYTNKPGVWGGLVDPDEVGADHPKCDQMHGMTLGAMIMAGKLTWRELGIFPELGVERFGTAPEGTACMIIEPYHAPSGQFHRMKPTIERIQNLQKSFPDIPLCIDEIQGGFGRTGRLWAHQHYTQEFKMTSPSKAIGYDLPILHPDFITIGKLAGGGLPLSALLGPKEIMESESV